MIERRADMSTEQTVVISQAVVCSRVAWRMVGGWSLQRILRNEETTQQKRKGVRLRASGKGREA
jgi:hypothetical protein